MVLLLEILLVWIEQEVPRDRDERIFGFFILARALGMFQGKVESLCVELLSYF